MRLRQASEPSEANGSGAGWWRRRERSHGTDGALPGRDKMELVHAWKSVDGRDARRESVGLGGGGAGSTPRAAVEEK